MSTYLAGLTDYIPNIQPFQPDLNFYSNVLATKQQQYDTGLKKINSIYGSVLNSAMLRGDNLERRDKYFKTIVQDVQKVSGMDLSLDQNVTQAKTLFDPILNDKHIVNDMIFTKRLQNSYQNAEQYRNCADPEKCNGEYWDTGVQALNYAADEFKNVSPDEALNLQAPSFTPYQNVTKKAIAAAKASGFNISYDHVEKGYIVTDTNGQLLLGKDGNGILNQYLYGVFGNDPKVQAMYSTKAMVDRKNFAKSYAAEKGITEDQAESYYLNNTLAKVIPAVEDAQKQNTSIRNKAEIDSKALIQVAKNNNGVTDGDGVQDAYSRLQDLIEKTNQTETFHENNANQINNAPKLNDIRALRSRVDNIVASHYFMNEINTAAAEYAMGTAKRELKADPYALASYNNNLDLNKALTLKKADQEYWIEQQKLLGKIGGGQNNLRDDVLQQLRDKNIGWDQLHKLKITNETLMDKKNLEKLAGLGLFSEGGFMPSKPGFVPSSGESFLKTYNNNVGITTDAIDKSDSTSKEYMKQIVSSMQKSYKDAVNDPDQDASIGKRAKILADAKNIFQGTGLDYQEVVLGNVSEKDLDTKNLSAAANIASMFQLKDKASRVYNSDWSDDKVVEMQIANQAAQGLIKERTNIQKQSLENVRATYMNEVKSGNMPVHDFYVHSAITKASYDKDGNILPVEKAYQTYVNDTHGYYLNLAEKEALKYVSPGDFAKGGYERYIEIGVKQAMRDDFEKKYPDVHDLYDSGLKSLYSKAGSPDVAGKLAMATAKALPRQIDGDLPLSGDYVNLKNIVSDLKNNSTPGMTYKTSESTNPKLVTDFMDMIMNDEAVGANIYTETQYLPGKDGSSVAMKVVLDDKTARKLNNLKVHDVVPVEMKSFVLDIPEGFGSAKNFIDKISPSSEDILLSQDGKDITVVVPDKGVVNVTNIGNGKLSIQPRTSIFNPETGKLDNFKIPPRILDEIDVKKAFLIGQDILNASYKMNDENKKKYLSKTPE